MATLDITTNIQPQLAQFAIITTNDTFFSSSIDMANFDNGVMYIAYSTVYTDGTYVLTLQESEDDSIWTDVPVAKLNDPVGNGNITISAAISDLDLITKLGAFSTKRYIRVKMISSGVTTGASINVIVNKKGEDLPVS